MTWLGFVRGCSTFTIWRLDPRAARDAAQLAWVRVRPSGWRSRKDIAAHFTDATRSSSGGAKREGMAARCLRMPLGDEGLSFFALVPERPLALARRLRVDPKLAARCIGGRALDIGFGDPSDFNLGFRRCFGAPPSAARAES